MGCKIIFAPEAIVDLAEAVRHIAKDDPETARRVGHALIERVTILENFPLAGSAVSESSWHSKTRFSPLPDLLSSPAGGAVRGHPALLAWGA